MPHQQASKLASVVDLDVDIGADAVDYKCVFPIFLSMCNAYGIKAPLQTRNLYQA